MATKSEVNAVYAAGLIQGITLVTFPALSTIFISPSEYGLSNTQYGTMFLPQVITAVTGSLLGGTLAARFGIKRVFLAGLVADLASMALLIASQFFTSKQPVAYGLLLAATACLGAERWFPPPLTYHVLPFLLAIMFVIIAALPSGVPAAGILSFALAGFGCSALLPLTISFASEQLLAMGASVAGAVIAFYQMGYGIAAFGTGPLVDAGVSLHVLFGFAAIAAVIMGGLSFTLARKSSPKVMAPAAMS